MKHLLLAFLLFVLTVAPVLAAPTVAPATPEPQLNFSHGTCENGKATALHFVLVHAPEGLADYGVVTVSGVWSDGTSFTSMGVPFWKYTGGTAHYMGFFRVSTFGVYLESGSVTVQGKTYPLHNPGDFSILGCGPTAVKLTSFNAWRWLRAIFK